MEDLIDQWQKLPEDKWLNLDTGKFVIPATALKKTNLNREFRVCSNEYELVQFLKELDQRLPNLNLDNLKSAHQSLAADQWLNVDTGRKVKAATAQGKRLQNPQFRICGDKAFSFNRFQAHLEQQPKGWWEAFFGKSEPEEPRRTKVRRSISEKTPEPAEKKGPVTRSQTKKSIPPALKTQIWEATFGNVLKSKCWCCRQTDLTANSFHAGHIHAEANGGTLDLSNLRPICQSCNSSMGTQNMLEYMDKHQMAGIRTLYETDPLQVYASTFPKNLQVDWKSFLTNYKNWCGERKVIVWAESVLKAVLKDRGHLIENQVRF